MLLDIEQIGDVLWQRFDASKAEAEWYYRGVTVAVKGQDDEAHSQFVQLEQTVKQVFG